MVHIGEKCGFYAVHTALSSHSHEHDRAIKPGREEGYSWQKTFTWVARKIHTQTRVPPPGISLFLLITVFFSATANVIYYASN